MGRSHAASAMAAAKSLRSVEDVEFLCWAGSVGGSTPAVMAATGAPVEFRHSGSVF